MGEVENRTNILADTPRLTQAVERVYLRVPAGSPRGACTTSAGREAAAFVTTWAGQWRCGLTSIRWPGHLQVHRKRLIEAVIFTMKAPFIIQLRVYIDFVQEVER